jgi:hypothetical protein
MEDDREVRDGELLETGSGVDTRRGVETDEDEDEEQTREIMDKPRADG